MKEPPGPSTRAESVTPEKPIFRDAFRRNRCRLLISGYYEWVAASDGK